MKNLKEIEPKRETGDGVVSASPVYTSTVEAKAPESANLSELFYKSVEEFGDSPCLGYRKLGEDGAPGAYEWYTYKQAGEMATNLSAFLTNECGLAPGGRVAVYGPNSPEWMVAMQACNRMGLYVVPLYDTLGNDALEYIMKHAEITAVCVASKKIGELTKALPQMDGQVKNVVVWGTTAEEHQQAYDGMSITLTKWEGALEAGAKSPVEPAGVTADDTCTIMYTSGTTGMPKGVLIKHGAVLSMVEAAVAWWKGMGTEFTHTDSFLSYLPLAHIFDRVLEEYMLHVGARIGYWRGDITGLVGETGDIAALKPSLFIGVPRVFDRIYAGFNKKMDDIPGFVGKIKRFLYNRGYRLKLAALKAGTAMDKAAPWYDKKVFIKVKQALGGNVRVVASGGAPLSAHVEDWLRVTMMCPVVQGYGLTETCASSFVAKPGDIAHNGTVGIPLPVTKFRLESVPEMNYDALDATTPKGEILISGASLFSGYYKEEEKTKEVLTDDGWFHTGDIGELKPDGALKIIDRMKNIFKLSQGEYVAAEKIEGVLKKSTLCNQLWIYGNSFEPYLVAIVVPGEGALAKAKELGKPVTDSSVAKALCTELAALGKAEGLKGFELPKAVFVHEREWTQENGLLTPTFKLKRPQLLKRYQTEIDSMYAVLSKNK